MTDAEAVTVEHPCVLGHPESVEATDGLLCRRHYGWIIDTLREIEELWALRGVVVMPELRSFVEFSSHATREGSPAPGRIGVMALDDARNGAQIGDGDVPDAPGIVGGWYLIVCEELPLRNEPDRPTFTHILHTLRGQRRWVARQPWVDHYAQELNDVHRALAMETGAGMWPQPLGVCPNCQARLYVTPGVDAITCRRCGSSWAGADYLRLRLILERDERKAGGDRADAAANHG